MKIQTAFGLFPLLALALAASAFGSEITPLGYTTSTIGDQGSWLYRDYTGTTLTDGMFGVAPWYDSYEGATSTWIPNVYSAYVGWDNTPEEDIDFTLPAVQTVNSIEVWSTQDNLSDVVLPNVFIYESANGVNWSSVLGSLITPASDANDNVHEALTVSGLDITDPFVKVALTQNGPWIFTDEIQFFGSSGSVPDSANTGLLLAGACVLVAALGVRSRRGPIGITG